MIALDLSRINDGAPYEVISSEENSNVYEFVTKYGVRYYVAFDKDELLQAGLVYQLSIINANHLKAPKDLAVKGTVVRIIDEFFYVNKAALLYICETGDGRQSLRNRLFVSWFNSSKRKNDFVIMTADIEDDGVMNYVALIVPMDSPDFVEIVKEFQESVNMFKNKP